MQVLSDWDTRLRSWGYEPLFCSVDSKMGLDSLASVLRDQTTVIVGPSGVGKSSLINALRNKPNSQVEADNWFDPVGLSELSVIICSCLCELLMCLMSVYCSCCFTR